VFFHRVVYVFRWNGVEWVREAELLAGDEAYEGPSFDPFEDRFGFEVAIDGDTIIACDTLDFPTNGDPNFEGATYIYRRTGTIWNLVQRYVIDNGAPYQKFGSRIAIDGATALIGNDDWRIPLYDSPSAAYIVNLCATDLNGDGVTDPADLGALIDGFGDVSGDSTDLNGDGVTDTADLGLLISQFGASCP